MSQTVEWKLKAKKPDGYEAYTTDNDAITWPKGTIFIRVRFTSGKTETESERKNKYRASRKNNADW